MTIAGGALSWSGPLYADCGSGAHLSTCIDADTFWPHPGPGSFTFIGASTTTPPSTFTLGLAATYLARPVVLLVPTADTSGAEVLAVDHLTDATLLFSLGLTDRLDAGVALPVAVYRTGLGVSPLTSLRSMPIAHGALRDVRVGAGLRLFGSPLGASCSEPFAMAARFELSLPTGDETSFAGDASVVAIPSISGEARMAEFRAGFEVGARLRETADLLGSRVGPQLSLALGIGADLISEGRLGLAVEAMALPTMVAQHQLSLDPSTGERIASGSRPPLVPAEWQASIRSAAVVDGMTFSLGAGTPLLIAGDSGITAPLYRVTLSVRYVPPSRESAASPTGP
jgi:hypothetical protein